MLLLSVVLGLFTVAFAYPSEQGLQIWGGNDTDISLHPWQVSLQTEIFRFCGGFLISSTWVVTGANCVESILLNETNLMVRAGSTSVNASGQLVNVSDIILHPEYNSSSFENDIALLELVEPVTDDTAKAVNLPSADVELAEGTLLNITGWGVTNSSRPSVILQSVEVPVVNRETCSDQYLNTSVVVTNTKFCAGYLGVGGKDYCFADFGGPAAVGDVVYGVISIGLGCASADYPGVYTQVSSYIDWIKETTGI